MRWVRAISIHAVLLAAIGPVCAIWVPQTRAEFVKAVSDGAGATKMERFVVERGLDEVYRDFEEHSSTCLDVEVKRTGYVGYYEVSYSDYNPTLRRSGKDAAEFTLQVAHRPRGVGHTPPPGGLYVMAVDLRSLGPGRTEVVLYRPTIGYKKVTQSLMEWASGEGDECPKLR